MPVLLAPFTCGEQWTYSHHDQEVRRALDFISVDGVTDGAPAIAAGWGYATQHVEDGGAGNYIVIDHGGDWVTYYFHLQSFSVPDGTFVNTGDEIGKVGTTGASSGPHLHHEQLFNGEGVDIVISGLPLAPYPSIYGIGAIVSNNCPMP
ncbi:MAG: M23 family metallopeptidase [Polyangiaceae bacterium]|nr:M23 family metallopeptidase [Polyangiaceae bacterium]